MSAESTVHELTRLLQGLVAEEPVDRGFCLYCDHYQDHADDCPWWVAKGYLGGGRER